MALSLNKPLYCTVIQNEKNPKFYQLYLFSAKRIQVCTFVKSLTLQIILSKFQFMPQHFQTFTTVLVMGLVLQARFQE